MLTTLYLTLITLLIAQGLISGLLYILAAIFEIDVVTIVLGEDKWTE